MADVDRCEPEARPQGAGQIVSSTDFMMPYTFGVELMGNRASLVDGLILWKDELVD